MSASLWGVETWDIAWRGGYIPWLREHASGAWREAAPTLIVLPTTADTYHAKALALDAGLSPLALQFVTPAKLRSRITTALGLTRTHPLREHLRLLLAIAAEEVGGAIGEAIAASPDTLLRAINVLGDGGWDVCNDGPPGARPIVARFTRQLDRCGFHLLHDTDRTLLAAARPVFARVLVLGFDAAHWPSWPLLAAAVRCAESADVFLRHPRTEAGDLDAAWIGTWEEHFQPAEPLAGETAPSAGTLFLVGHDAAEQSRAIVQQAITFLADPACERLGIVFPGPGALARRVAALLAERGIEHFDGLAHPTPGPLETRDWPAWLDLQESPRLPALLRFLRAHPGPQVDDLADALTSAFNELLLDDIDVLGAWLPGHADAIRAIPRLPARATFGEFVTAVDAAFIALGWTERAAELHRLTTTWPARLDTPIARRTFTSWLREVLVSTGTDRAPEGRHPYSRTHLLTAANARTQTWTHLILGGLNESQWPPAFDESGWLGESDIADLNARTRTLNRRARGTGRQGEGHDIVKPGHTLCLGPAQQRALARRDFEHLRESAMHVALAASVIDEATPDRALNPSEFFIRAFHTAHRRALSHATMSALRAETTRWLAASALWPDAAPTPHPEVRRAYDARRDETKPFGEFEFALREPPAEPLRLSATDWQNVLGTPSLIWMSNVLGASPRDDGDGDTPWNLAIGSWVHRWLSAIAAGAPRGTLSPLPAADEIRARTRRAAIAFRDRVAAIAPLPEWWLATWQQALQLAQDFAELLTTLPASIPFATEWSLPRDTTIPLGADGTLPLRGRIDLLLAPADDDRWIIDFKTGQHKALSAAKVAGGDGLQLAIYALAIAHLGARTVGITRLTTALDLAAPQLTLDDIGRTALPDLWRGLARMAASGVFGQLGSLRDEYSHADPHPLATLRIDPDILDEKWARTHPDFRSADE
ncbi:MAG: PD-(D/E)XK nuclease family protein [Chthoniobacteraceae bacterium]